MQWSGDDFFKESRQRGDRGTQDEVSLSEERAVLVG